MQNIVSYEQNVRAVLTKITLDEADAGIVYATDIGAARDQVGTLDIPDDLNVIASYPILALPGRPQASAAQAFVDFVLSPAGQQVLQKYGFSPAGINPVISLQTASRVYWMQLLFPEVVWQPKKKRCWQANCTIHSIRS